MQASAVYTPPMLATIALAFIDQETGLLPDSLTLPLVWIGLLLNLHNAFISLQEAVIGAVAGLYPSVRAARVSPTDALRGS